ncbi:WD40-repeat-containing domain protein [Gorgonomyces haynaldii]|nr:WD40-repeat-containing domain protein [Gorgonomyces haynaldii]
MPTYTGHSIVTHTGRVETLDQSFGKNIRVANRKIVVTTLKKSLRFDVDISCFDINAKFGIMAVCAGRTISIINLETLVLRNQLGKAGGNLHKNGINGCSINLQGTHIATCGNDKRIIVWSMETWKASLGRTQGRDLPRTILDQHMRHAAAVRCFDFNYENTSLVVVGQMDGNVSIWNTEANLKIDNISPDPEWNASQGDSLEGWQDKKKYHTGAILSVRLSPNQHYLCTGSSDNTCKLWVISSYQKNIDTIRKELESTEDHYRRLNGYIDILDERYDQQIAKKQFSSLLIGEVPLSVGYHAHLRFTYQHEAPVLCIRFSTDSNLVVTGSSDSTCRLWSPRRGEQLFQINLPGPITGLKVDHNSNIYTICKNRMIVFSTECLQDGEVKNMLNELRGRKSVVSASKKSNIKGITISELQRLIAHGLLLPRALMTMVQQYPDIDIAQLYLNMKKYNTTAKQIQRLVANNARYNPRDIFHALSSKEHSNGNPISSLMNKLGYGMVSSSEQVTIYLNADDIGQKTVEADVGFGNNWLRPSNEEPPSSDSDDEEYRFDYSNVKAKPEKGKIVHFIPSEHMKLIKGILIDLRSARPKGTDTEENMLFPNFDPTTDQNYRPVGPKRTLQTRVDRFNESVKGAKVVQPKKTPKKKKEQPMEQDGNLIQLPVGEQKGYRESVIGEMSAEGQSVRIRQPSQSK